MKKINVVFTFLICLNFSITINAQKEKTSSTTTTELEDRFAYSYGVLLGDNLRTMGLTTNMVDMPKFFEGIQTSLKAAKGEVSESAAQQLITTRLGEIQSKNEAKAQGKQVEPLPKASLDEFMYNYGIVIALSWKNFDLKTADISTKSLEEGIVDALNKAAKISTEDAQAEVNKKFQSMLQERTDKQLVENKTFMDKNKTKPNVVTLPSGIQYEILTKGTGKQATSESTVVAHYHGTLINGTVFDSSVERGEPISFSLSGVIKGWQEIIPMMREKGKWRIFVPPHLAYGNRERGNIPANSMLIFEIELISAQ